LPTQLLKGFKRLLIKKIRLFREKVYLILPRDINGTDYIAKKAGG
jgi:hypothetical protein